MREGSDCPSGKEQFATRAAAGERRDWWRKQPGGQHMTVYRCEMCDLYHLANSRNGKGRLGRAAKRTRRRR